MQGLKSDVLQESCFYSYALTDDGLMHYDRGCDNPANDFVSCLSLIGQSDSLDDFAQGWAADVFDVPV